MNLKIFMKKKSLISPETYSLFEDYSKRMDEYNSKASEFVEDKYEIKTFSY